MIDAKDLITALALVPHPEGGYFREIFRSGAEPMSSKGLTDPAGALMTTDREPPPRNVLTSIYWMVDRRSPIGFWCSNASDHVHYFHAGAALTYHIIHPDGRLETQRLGPDPRRGDVLQLVVRGGCWKAAHLEEGDYCLLGEAVAPGFDFRDLRWATEDDLAAVAPGLLAGRADLRGLLRTEARPDLDAYYEGKR